MNKLTTVMLAGAAIAGGGTAAASTASRSCAKTRGVGRARPSLDSP